MEYIDGVNLADLLKRQGPPGIALSLEVAHQTLLALGYLHRKNVVHRDIAPDNLMLTHDEDRKPLVKLIDLGIAKTLDRPGEMTSTGVFLGKLKYASPEQFGSLPAGEKLDGRCDLYALGSRPLRAPDRRPPLRGREPERAAAGAPLRSAAPLLPNRPGLEGPARSARSPPEGAPEEEGRPFRIRRRIRPRGRSPPAALCRFRRPGRHGPDHLEAPRDSARPRRSRP